MRAFIAAKQVQFTKTVPDGRLIEVQSSHGSDLDPRIDSGQSEGE